MVQRIVTVLTKKAECNEVFGLATLSHKQMLEFGIFANLTIRQAIDLYGHDAIRALKKEFEQLLRLKVFLFHYSKDLTPEIIKKRIPS